MSFLESHGRAPGQHILLRAACVTSAARVERSACYRCVDGDAQLCSDFPNLAFRRRTHPPPVGLGRMPSGRLPSAFVASRWKKAEPESSPSGQAPYPVLSQVSDSRRATRLRHRSSSRQQLSRTRPSTIAMRSSVIWAHPFQRVRNSVAGRNYCLLICTFA